MKFSLAWLGDFVDTSAAGGEGGVRKLLEQAGFPLESIERSGEDTILDVEITPNRPDAMSHRGLAREIAAMADLPLALGATPADLDDPGSDVAALASVAIEVPRLCRRFGARVIRGIGDSPAPERVRQRLVSIGGKSISGAVDATNYVLWDIGQPLHAFDLDKLRGARVVVRRARRGERLVLLDGNEYELAPSDVVVADAERPVSLAGIMGGRDTAVTAQTRDVLLEAAWWDPIAIRRTSRRLGLHTDASHRFERGADPEAIPEALDRAARILLDAAGGRLAPGRLDARGSSGRAARQTPLRLARLRRLSGDDRLDLEFAARALTRLGFAVARRGKRLAVGAPSWRADISIEDDLIEETLRVYGYDRLPSKLPPTRGGGGHVEPMREVEERFAQDAVSCGLLETQSSPFVDRESDERSFSAWLAAAGSAAQPLRLANPLDQTRADLRATLLPGLLDAVMRNVHRGERAVGLFEVGRVFDRAGDPDDPVSFESRRVAFALAGDWRTHWSSSGVVGRADFFDAKGLAQRLLEPWLETGALVWRPFACEAFAGSTAAVAEIPQHGAVGVVGSISRVERAKRKLSEPVFACEIRVEAVASRRAPARFAPYSSYPPIEADLSFAHSRETTWQDIEAFVAEQNLADLESVQLVDRYDGPGGGEARVKTTIRLTFRSFQRTLEQDEVNRAVERLVERLAARFGAVVG